MSTLDDLAGKLAEDTLAAMETTGNDRLYVEVGDLLAASSQSLEEAFLTEIRMRLAEQGARRFLDKKIAAARAAAAAPDPST